MDIISQSVDYFPELDHSQIQTLCYFLQSMRFLPNEEIFKEGSEMKLIMFIRSGLVDLKMNSSLFEKYIVQRLYPGCSYGGLGFL